MSELAIAITVLGTLNLVVVGVGVWSGIFGRRAEIARSVEALKAALATAESVEAIHVAVNHDREVMVKKMDDMNLYITKLLVEKAEQSGFAEGVGTERLRPSSVEESKLKEQPLTEREKV